MIFEEDDFPDGFLGSSSWAPVEKNLELFHTRQYEDRDDTTRSHYKRFYDRKKNDPVWVAARRAYYRQRYAKEKLTG